jgi:outer membrane protein
VGRDWSVGLQLEIPLFEGLARSYQEAQARAEVEGQRVAVDQARSQVGLDVWTSYQALQTATHSLTHSSTLLDLAQASTAATQDRYRAGVGSILEWLNAQSALATAKRQRLQALTDWRAARLQLAGALGQLGMGQIAAP